MRKIYKAYDVSVDTEKTLIDSGAANSKKTNASDGYDKENGDGSEETTPGNDLFFNMAHSEAQKIKRQAELQANTLLAETKEACAKMETELRQTAWQEGYDKGFKKGEAEAKKLTDEAQAIRSEAVKIREKALKDIEPQTIELIAKLVKKLIGDVSVLQPQIIKYLIRSGLSETTSSGEVRIRVSQEDYENAVSDRNEILSKIESGAKIDFIRDLSLKKMDCIIETPFGNIDCSLDGQYEILKQSLYYLLTRAGDTVADD